MNVLATISHVENLRFVARAFALLADQFDISQKLHLNGDGPVALADLTAPTRDIERKVPRTKVALFRLRKGGK